MRTKASVLARQETSCAPRWQRWAARIALATALATALAYFPYRLLDGSGARKAEALRIQYERTVSATEAVAEENARLRRQIDALKNDVSAIEDIARSQLGMVRGDEIIFRIDRPTERPTRDRAAGDGVATDVGGGRR